MGPGVNESPKDDSDSRIQRLHRRECGNPRDRIGPALLIRAELFWVAKSQDDERGFELGMQLLRRMQFGN